MKNDFIASIKPENISVSRLLKLYRLTIIIVYRTIQSTERCFKIRTRENLMDNLNKTKMMKKILMLLLQLVLITVCFCGCRDDQPSDQPSEPVLSASVDGFKKAFLWSL